MGNVTEMHNQDADFEIIDEGFDDENGEKVTIGVESPDSSIMTIFNNTKAVHLLALNDDSKSYDPRGVIMDIIQEFSNLDHGADWLENRGLQVQVDYNA
jgi:hypothetical protein